MLAHLVESRTDFLWRRRRIQGQIGAGQPVKRCDGLRIATGARAARRARAATRARISEIVSDARLGEQTVWPGCELHTDALLVLQSGGRRRLVLGDFERGRRAACSVDVETLQETNSHGWEERNSAQRREDKQSLRARVIDLVDPARVL